MASLFKVGDNVKIISGPSKAKTSVIEKISGNMILVKGINTVKKSVKPSKENPEGGFIMKDMPIHISNIMHCDDQGKASRIGFKIEDGKKKRFYKKTGKFLKN